MKRHEDEGFILLTSLLVLTGLATLTTTGLTRAMADLLAARYFVAEQAAFHLAEGGLDDADRLLKTLPLLPVGDDPVDPFTGTACDPNTNEPDTVARQHPMGSGYYLVCVDPSDENDTSHIDTFTITVTSHTAHLTRTVRSVIRTESFARFAYFTDKESSPGGPTLWFKSGELIEGPLHTNDQLHINGDPVFDGPVSSVASTITYMHGGPPLDNPQFLQGPPALGVPEIPMSSMALAEGLNKLKGSALRLSGDTTVRLNGAWMFVTNTGAGWLNHPVAVGTTPALFVEGGTLLLNGGILDGQLTLGSDQDIVISNAVQYACDPETLPVEDPRNLIPDDVDCKNPATGAIEYNDDLLGLVAHDNVRISKDAIVDPVTRTLSIQASIMAIEGSFKVDRYNVGAPKGTLHVFGGIIQKLRGPVGTFNPDTRATTSGYSKHYRYDHRFLRLSPPVYPTTGRIETVLWQEL